MIVMASLSQSWRRPPDKGSGTAQERRIDWPDPESTQRCILPLSCNPQTQRYHVSLCSNTLAGSLAAECLR